MVLKCFIASLNEIENFKKIIDPLFFLIKYNVKYYIRQKVQKDKSIEYIP